MQKNILLLSRDCPLLDLRALVLEKAGYSVLKCTSIAEAVPLARKCHMSIVGHTFKPEEQSDFVERAHEVNAQMPIVCLGFGLVEPDTLLKIIASCLETEPGDPRVWKIEPTSLIEWSLRRQN